MSCPWCNGEDKNFRPLRFGYVPCANSWHNEDAQQENEPCKKHDHLLPCPYCRIEELKGEIVRLEEVVDDLYDELEKG